MGSVYRLARTCQGDDWSDLSDIAKFWIGQLLSNLGSAFTAFALPLLVYRITGSSFDIALVAAVESVPMLLLGLVIGAVIDRVDRRRLMIATDVLRACVVVSIPVLDVAGILPLWWLYVVAFINGALWVAFSAAEYTAVRNLVPGNALLAVNGRLQAGFHLAQVAGPIVAGAVLAANVPLTVMYGVDAVTFLASALSLMLIRTTFAAGPRVAQQSIRSDIVEGLRYTIGHPLLRNISLLAVMVNLAGATVIAQLVFFAKEVLAATDAQIGVLFGAGSIGIAVSVLLAHRLRRHVSFSVATLGAIMTYGVAIMVFAGTRSFWLALVVWAIGAGMPYLYAVQTVSLRQTIVPDHMLGRIITVAQVLAWSANPLGLIIGGWAITATSRVDLVYGVIGVVIFLTGCVFWATALGRADRHGAPANPL